MCIFASLNKFYDIFIMSKFKCYYQSSPSSSRTCFATVSSLDEAAKRCDERIGCDRNHECIESLKARRYYMIGYGPAEVSIEEVSD